MLVDMAGYQVGWSMKFRTRNFAKFLNTEKFRVVSTRFRVFVYFQSRNFVTTLIPGGNTWGSCSRQTDRSCKYLLCCFFLLKTLSNFVTLYVTNTRSKYCTVHTEHTNKLRANKKSTKPIREPFYYAWLLSLSNPPYFSEKKNLSVIVNFFLLALHARWSRLIKW
jgi:hypothetical protein